MELFEKELKREYIYEGKILKLRHDKVELPDGKVADREIIEHSGGSGVLAVTENDEILLVKQYRRPYDEVTYEIPAGKLNPGENPEENARRELSEETGLTAKNIVHIGDLYTTPALIDEVIHMYIATDLTQGEQHLDYDEFVNTLKIPLSKAVDMVMAGEIKDSKTQTVILKADKYFERQKKN
jgi:ADP-ribose pyrophosphatase